MCLSFAAAGLLIAAQWQVPSPSQSYEAEVSGTHVSQPTPTPATSAPPKDVWMEVDLSDRQVKVLKAGRVKATYPIAIGQAGWETPTGAFKVTEMEKNPLWQHPITQEIVDTGPDNPLGSRWIGFWSDDKTQIGFHGTNQADLIGQAVSHGCIRMKNQDIEAMYSLVGVGTPVKVRP